MNSHSLTFHYALSFFKDIGLAWASKSSLVVRQPRWVRWKPPDSGAMLLNTDGSVLKVRVWLLLVAL